ncbi:hypothetical protein THAOC_24136 [Thalassiosira oceanica]|uniref:Uncharacterized protein n=1 Tax=Thalassiosira oceanica TaxID=159749 RepID=K0SBB9_THAOC|nr:hypothetical protein THAOC_24136 [Thalassiosira oceanica]|eukprot:EJK56042.1 hypothetical protein THAOC_24136 [Thalassiosira oceanica]
MFSCPLECSDASTPHPPSTPGVPASPPPLSEGGVGLGLEAKFQVEGVEEKPRRRRDSTPEAQDTRHACCCTVAAGEGRPLEKPARKVRLDGEACSRSDDDGGGYGQYGQRPDRPEQRADS